MNVDPESEPEEADTMTAGPQHRDAIGTEAGKKTADPQKPSLIPFRPTIIYSIEVPFRATM